MKTKLQFDPTDTEMLRRALNTMCKPARRHKCSRCPTVFECQFCTIAEDAHLHTTHPYLCEDCIEVLGIKTVFVGFKGGEYHLQEVDYVTGQRMQRYRVDSIVNVRGGRGPR